MSNTSYATGDQFWENEELREPSAFERPDKAPKNGADRYANLAQLVRSKLESFEVEVAASTNNQRYGPRKSPRPCFKHQIFREI